MTTQSEYGALTGITVLERGDGVAGSYCGKLFADMGAQVYREPATEFGADYAIEPDPDDHADIYRAYLNAGKLAADREADGVEYDIVINAEGAVPKTESPPARFATLDLSWFGRTGPWSNLPGTDITVLARAGLLCLVGPSEGPPLMTGVHHVTTLAGTTAFATGVAALIGNAPSTQRFDISVLESILILGEYQIALSESLGEPVRRVGINRFTPTCPVSIHQCKEGWIGITPITPAQWQAFCLMLDLPDLAHDPDLQLTRNRGPHVERIEAALDERFLTRTTLEWAALARKHRVPMVIVPDARGIMDHPIFNARESFSTFTSSGETLRVPRTPLSLQETPPRRTLDKPVDSARELNNDATSASLDAPLAGVRIADFSMGWAGPLATRMLADLGAEVIKIEAGRYPDWWRSVDWSPEAIASKQFEASRHFSALNRGKKSVSVDLTVAEGRALVSKLLASCDVVAENQAAGVMSRLGFGYEALSEERPDLIMLSMSAFGANNEWSDTRAYGSVLEQGSGLPSFAGVEGAPPTMTHLAYGDPVGGLYGAAALLCAVFHQRRTGHGQWINGAQIEAMLPLAAPALLIRQLRGREPSRRGNRHPALVPHGCFRAREDDVWIAIAADDATWPILAEVIGRPDWARDKALQTAAERRQIETDIEAAIASWTQSMGAHEAEQRLVADGVAAAVACNMLEVTQHRHLIERGVFLDLERPHIGVQRQCGFPAQFAEGQRYPLRGVAPFLGGDSEALLARYADVDAAAFEELLQSGIVSLQPTQLRG